MANRVEVQLGLNSRGFVTGLEEAKTKLNQFVRGIGQSFFGQYLGAQGFVNLIQKIGQSFTRAGENAERILNMEEIFGGGVEWVQKLDVAARQSGTSLEKFSKVFTSIAKAREDALGGKGKEMAAFARFGINYNDLKLLTDTSEIVKIIMRNVQKFGVPQETVIALQELGFTARQIPLLMKDIEQYGGWINTEQEIQQMDRLNNEMEGFWARQWKRITEVYAYWGTQIEKISNKNRELDLLDVLINPLGWGEFLGGAIWKTDRPGYKQLSDEAYLREKDALRDRQKSEEALTEAKIAADEASYRNIWSLTTEEAEKRYGVKKPWKVPKKPKKEEGIMSLPDLDEFARQGLFLGGAAFGAMGTMRVQQDQLRSLQSIDDGIKGILSKMSTADDQDPWQ